MQPPHWQPPASLSAQEEQMVMRIRHAKLFVFLRYHRHELFDESFSTANWRTSTGQAGEDTHPSLLRNSRLSVILQAYTDVSDDEVIEATLMDRSFQLVLENRSRNHAAT